MFELDTDQRHAAIEHDLIATPPRDQYAVSALESHLNLAVAMMGGNDTGPAIEVLAALPLEKPYIWRVASALMWAFFDFDSRTVEADRQTISPEDGQQLVDLLKHRPLQFCLFLNALLGQKNMELMMLSAIKNGAIAFQTMQERSGTNVVSRAKSLFGSWQRSGEGKCGTEIAKSRHSRSDMYRATSRVSSCSDPSRSTHLAWSRRAN